MDAFTSYKLVERVLGARRDQVERAALGRIPGRPAARAAREPGRRAAVLHRLEGPQHRPPRSRDRARLEAQRIRPVPDRRRPARRRRDRRRHLRALGLAFVPPELRENRGEIEAAESRHAARACSTRADLRGDLHMHTTATDGRADAETMAHAARAAGHSSTSPSPITARRWRWPTASTSARALEHARRIRALNDRLEGITRPRRHRVRHPRRRHDGSRRRLPRRARHRHRLGAFGVQPGRSADDRPHPARHRMSVGRRARAPDGPAHSQAGRLSRKLRSPDGAAAAAGVAVEINCQIERLDLDENHARLARDRGVKLMIDSDAHSPAALGLLRWGASIARRAWLQPGDVLNTLPVEEFRASLRRNKGKKPRARKR